MAHSDPGDLGCCDLEGEDYWIAGIGLSPDLLTSRDKVWYKTMPTVICHEVLHIALREHQRYLEDLAPRRFQATAKTLHEQQVSRLERAFMTMQRSLERERAKNR